ncbi:MAG: hypothetical protein DI536_28890 [Archangium gephyra]|uniref:HK97 gp10 family phage protein n=1 Tax=Archangium gephyra TaxID=48 RepID=A0A2W5T6I2_9BACT|nr:MAG: hypothetical protein DI536_28890 [Archangium gephyra]
MKIQGLKQLDKQLKHLAEDTRPKVLKAAVRAAFKPVVTAAMAKVPVDTGELRAGITVATGQKDKTVAAGIVIANNTTAMKQARVAAAAFGEEQLRGAPARRWHLTELGTKTQAAQPFLRPALDENASTVSERLKEELQKRIDKAIKKGRG